MRGKRESTIENHGNKVAKRNGVKRALKLNTLGHRSYPDREYFIHGGIPVLFEYKKPGGKLTPLQADTITDLLRLGYRVYVVDSKEQAEAILEAEIKEGKERLRKQGATRPDDGTKRALDSARLHAARREVAPEQRVSRTVARSRSR